jgi:hypothetical protein
VRRRIKSVSLSPEHSGLCGCWRFIAVERLTIDLAIGLYNLERKRGRTKALSLPSWQRSMTQSAALKRVMN